MDYIEHTEEVPPSGGSSERWLSSAEQTPIGALDVGPAGRLVCSGHAHSLGADGSGS
jgi:hypothetical protein